MASHRVKEQKGTGSVARWVVLLTIVAVVTFYGTFRTTFHPNLWIPHSRSSVTGAGTLVQANLGAVAPDEGSSKAAPRIGCHPVLNTEYDGQVLKPGEGNVKVTAEECCAECKAHPTCNVWAFQTESKECHLKQQDLDPLMKNIRIRWQHEGLKWTSGAVYDDAELEQRVMAEVNRIKALKANPDLPLVFLDVSIKGVPVGRIEFVLFIKEAPLAAENFRALCTGEKGVAPEGALEGAGKPYHFKGNYFYRIIEGFICQGGSMTESVYGGEFKDDEEGLKLEHDRKGLLSMANLGPNTNRGHFSIMMGPQGHLNGKHVVFGEVVEGWEVVEAINALSKSKSDKTANKDDEAMIVDSGELRRGKGAHFSSIKDTKIAH